MGLNISRRPGESVVLYRAGKAIGRVTAGSIMAAKLDLLGVQVEILPKARTKISLLLAGERIGSLEIVKATRSRVAFRFCLIQSIRIVRAEIPVRTREVANV